MGSAYSVGDLSRWTLRFYVAHGSLPTENRSVHPEMLRAIDAPNTMSHHSDLEPRCTAILQIWLPNATRRLPATYTPQLRLRRILVCTNRSGMEAQPPTRSSGDAMGVRSHFLWWLSYDNMRANSGVEAKGSLGACRLDSASLQSAAGEWLECPLCAVIAKA